MIDPFTPRFGQTNRFKAKQTKLKGERNRNSSFERILFFFPLVFAASAMLLYLLTSLWPVASLGLIWQ